MTRSLRSAVLAPLVAALVVATAACSSSGGAGSPAGPSALGSSSATVQGVVNPGGAGTSSTHTSALSGLRVSVVGTSLVTQTDSAGRFTLQGVPSGAITLRFEGRGIDARLTLSGLTAGQVLEIEVQVSGSNATLTGNDRPTTPSPSPSPSPGTTEIEFTGNVDSVGASSLVVAGRTVNVSPTTEIKRGDTRITLAEIQVGERAKVEGAEQADGSVLAREIEVGGDDDDDEFELSGTIGAVTPPTLTVNGLTILTDTQTVIKRNGTTITLADLLPGERVEVKGRFLSDGTRLATRIKVEDDDDDDDDDEDDDDEGDDDDDDDDGDNS